MYTEPDIERYEDDEDFSDELNEDKHVNCPGCQKFIEIINNGDEVCGNCTICGREWEWGT